MVDEPKQRRGRGPGKTPAMVGTSIRLPRHIADYFTAVHGRNKQKVIREVLMQYVLNRTNNPEGEANG